MDSLFLAQTFEPQLEGIGYSKNEEEMEKELLDC